MVLKRHQPSHRKTQPVAVRTATGHARHGRRPTAMVTVAQLCVLALASSGIMLVSLQNMGAERAEAHEPLPVIDTSSGVQGIWQFSGAEPGDDQAEAPQTALTPVSPESSAPTSLPQVTISVEDVEAVGFNTTVQSEIVTEVIAFKTVEQRDSTLLKGTRKVKVEGQAGEKVTTFLVHRDADGVVLERSQVAHSVTSEPVDRVVLIGTKNPPPPPKKDPLPQGGTGEGTTPAAAKALAKTMAAQRYGWTGQQYQCLLSLWTGESGWRYRAANPTSTARGIPQAMMSIHFGRNWRTSAAAARYLNNADVQIAWGLDYIYDRYRNPCAAYNFWLRQSPHWY